MRIVNLLYAKNKIQDQYFSTGSVYTSRKGDINA